MHMCWSKAFVAAALDARHTVSVRLFCPRMDGSALHDGLSGAHASDTVQRLAQVTFM